MSKALLLVLIDVVENLCGLIREIIMEACAQKSIPPQDIAEVKSRLERMMRTVWFKY